MPGGTGSIPEAEEKFNINTPENREKVLNEIRRKLQETPPGEVITWKFPEGFFSSTHRVGMVLSVIMDRHVSVWEEHGVLHIMMPRTEIRETGYRNEFSTWAVRTFAVTVFIFALSALDRTGVVLTVTTGAAVVTLILAVLAVASHLVRQSSADTGSIKD